MAAPYIVVNKKLRGKKMKTIIILLLTVISIFPQTVYELPFSSKGNEIELTVENKSNIELNTVKVKAIDLPSWITFVKEESILKNMKSNSESTAVFKFAVEKEAPVGETRKLKFQITNNRGESWEKEIEVKVGAPKKFELNQNYPNPFNPSTTITYTIPTPQNPPFAKGGNIGGFVTLKIYDILGREVATLVKKAQKPGYYKVQWNANNYASGMYIYQLMLNKNSSKMKVLRKKMLLLR